MGRSATKEIENQSLQSGDSSLSLLRLPNELIDMILIYLSSGDIIPAFGDIKSDRIQALIQPYLIHFDLTSVINKEEQRIIKYLTDQSDHLKSLRLTDRQLTYLFKSNFQFNELRSIHIINIEDNQLFLFDLDRMIPLIHSLTLDFLSDEMSHDSIGCLARILFSQRKPWQIQLTELRINHLHIPFGFESLRPMSNLRHLTINLRYDRQLLDLCLYLPNIESFRVDIRRSSHISCFPSFNPVNISPYLKKLIISGCFAFPTFLYKFILIYKSSLVNLKLINIVHSMLIDGHQLRDELVQNLSPNIRFQFHLQFPLDKRQPFHIDTYRKTFNWQEITLEKKLHDDDPVLIVSSNEH